MKSVKIVISLLLSLSCAVCVLTACNGQAPSLLKPTESTTKEGFDKEKFDEEFYRTSVSESETEAVTESTEATSAVSENTGTTAATTGTAKATTTAKNDKTTSTSAVSTSAASSTSKPAASQPTGTTAAYLVDTKIDTKESKTNYKYGVVKVDVTSTYYDIYSDGKKVQTDQKKYTRYDYSKFKASTSDLMSEAKSNKVSHSSEIKSAESTLNGYRKSAGKSTLTVSDELSTAAAVRATEIAYSGKMSAKRPDGSPAYDILDDMGISYGYAIPFTAKGYTSGKSAVEAMKGSNYDNMVSGNYTKIGVGAATAPDGVVYWCVFLASEKE